MSSVVALQVGAGVLVAAGPHGILQPGSLPRRVRPLPVHLVSADGRHGHRQGRGASGGFLGGLGEEGQFLPT